MRNELKLLKSILGSHLFRAINYPKMMPINIVVNVTNRCNSFCKTCFIWKLYQEKPELENLELETWEFERTFQSLGKQLLWATIAGGETYLREDLPDICLAINKHCEPYFLNLPTNGLLPTRIEKMTREILENCPDTQITVNFSLDGIGEKHDHIRGVHGNFKKLLDSFKRLKKLQESHHHLNLGFHTVISKYNFHDVTKIYDFVRELGLDSYITELAEERRELFNLGRDITPSNNIYFDIIDKISDRIKIDYLKKKNINKITPAFRIVYYDLVKRILREEKQVIPCFSSYASGQISPFGDVTPCSVLSYSKTMGNLREVKYDFRKIWFSKKAEEVRRFIKNERCFCPIANASYINILCDFKLMLKVAKMIYLSSNENKTSK